MFRALSVRVAGAARPAADAMAREYVGEVRKILQLRERGVGEFAPKAPDLPPARVTGHLQGTVRSYPRGGGYGTATTMVRPDTVYAVVQEYGQEIRAARMRYMHWVNTGGEWFMKRVYVGPHPYMRPAVAEAIASGALTRAAMNAFRASTAL